MQFTEKEVTNGVAPPNTGKTTKKPKRNLPALPSVAGASDMSDVVYGCKVDASPVSWESLPLYSPFSLSADGSYPLVKVSKSKACDLRTGKSILAGSGRCYKVVF
ncbi:MAG: hypothetical protein SAL70_41250 [Scytonema sp. PMC 1070.18]|nr:hypothetical protein [Scytonema sp. PMC 1070.18]